MILLNITLFLCLYINHIDCSLTHQGYLMYREAIALYINPKNTDLIVELESIDLT